jgi:spoIIIJ-associated protein
MKRFEGHTLEDALQTAATALAVERYQLDYRVILEKRGFLGGTKRVVVEAAIADDADDRQPAGLTNASRPVVPPVVTERSGNRPFDRPQKKNRGQGQGQTRGPERSFRRRQEAEDLPAPADIIVEEAPEQGTESAEASRARTWVEELLTRMNFSVAVRSEETADQLTLRLYGGERKAFEAQDGELLDSVQVLVNKALVDRETGKPIELDTSGFKSRRTAHLAGQARAAADEVRASGRERLLPAMSPIERRIIHVTLQEEVDVTTQSRGDGFLKRVAVVPREVEAKQQES